ncbi:MAG: hypothetical protein L0I26_06745 [Lactococcus lactis]|nr:hypothetical protein [Lactococcus lactis]
MNAGFRYVYRSLNCINCRADQKSAKKIAALALVS